MDTIDKLSSSEQLSLPSWKTWLAIGGSKLAQDALALVETLADLGERRRQRRALLSLDEWMRKDIGLSAADVWLEARKPLWRK
jgi:uncharacterized protein YjiS (DUF1127 family)